jgi:ribosomal protein L7/L12
MAESLLETEIALLKARVDTLESEVRDLLNATRGGAGVPSPAASAGVDPLILQLVQQGKKIEAIKRYRELHGTDLKTSKDAVEALARQLAPEPSAT